MGSFLDEETAETEKHLVPHSGCQVTRSRCVRIWNVDNCPVLLISFQIVHCSKIMV